MGGRGSSSGISTSDKPVSEKVAKWYYNSSKKSDALKSSGKVKRDPQMERVIVKENIAFINNIQTKEEAIKVRNYIIDRTNENKREIAKLGSADAVFKNQKLAIEHRKLINMNNAMQNKMHEFSQKVQNGDTSAMHDPNRTTTTYSRARKRRINNFNAWFFGSSK